MTATATWTIDQSAATEEFGSVAVEEPSENYAETSADETDGMSIDEGDYEAVQEESDVVVVVDDEPLPEEAMEAETEAPSEVGSVFGGAGTTAIIAAIALVLAAAGIAIVQKKKR